MKSPNAKKETKAKALKNLKTTNSHDIQTEVSEADRDDGQSTAETAGGTTDSPRPEIQKSIFSMSSFDAEKDLPIVYSPNYNMSMIGMEILHQFDTKKYAKLADMLNSLFLDTQYARFPNHQETHNAAAIRRLRYLEPNRPVDRNELALHHGEDYLRHIFSDKSLIARITETWALNLLPISVLQSRVLTPICWQISGTIFALHLAMQHGWAINLGGGFHTASAGDGETFSIFNDILIAIKYVWRKHPLQKFLIIDLDAHQATGLERDLMDMDKKKRKNVHILDVYNGTVQPPDERALEGIDTKVELARFTGDETYMKKLRKGLEEAVAKFKPTVIIYLNGQDVLKDDQLGLLNLSDDAFKVRDQVIFSFATETLRVPIVMLLGGGYTAKGLQVFTHSIRNLFARGLIWGGHRSGSRSLSRPRKSPNETKDDKGNSTSASKSSKAGKLAGTDPMFKQLKTQMSPQTAKGATGNTPPQGKIAPKQAAKGGGT